MQWIKRLIAGDELKALERYRRAADLARRWNRKLPQSSDTAEWITQVGEGVIPAEISDFRDALERDEAKEYLLVQEKGEEDRQKENARVIAEARVVW